MPEPSTHSSYSFEDIQRYLNGSMSAAEMHAIEKAALQDSFLADAIDGYNEVNALTAREHLDQINEGLLKEKTLKIIALKRNTLWRSVAAAVIVIAGIGLISIYILKDTNSKQIAQVNNTDSLLVKPDFIQKSNLSSKTDTQLSTAGNSPQRDHLSSLKKENKNQTVTANEDENAEVNAAMPAPIQHDNAYSNASPETFALKQTTDSMQFALQGKTAGISIAENNFSGKVLDENSKPIIGATIKSLSNKTATETDLNGNFSLKDNDSSLDVAASTVGYATKKIALHPNSKNMIVLKSEISSLNEVAVTAFGIQRSKSSAESPMPVGGWENFHNYVISQLEKDSIKLSFSDTVEIEFLIDKNGNPYDIQIIKPLDNERNSKAIKILKTGPKWMSRSINEKTKVAIPF